MYLHRFGLACEPFSIAPDPRFLFMSERHREALAHLLYGLQGGGGFVVLTGEVGAGKTTVCRCFLEQVPAHCQVAYVFNPRLTELELLQTVCEEFHVAVPASAAPTIKHYLDPLNDFLLDTHAKGRQCVLVIDEAQNLSPALLEQLRLLTNLETAERKLLQIILIGQPELRALLAQPALEPLAQRVIARYHLQALSPDETEAYIRHRLGVAGQAGALPFEPGALRRVHALTRGVPRRINLLCDRALLGAYAADRDRVDAHIVVQAAREVFDGAAGAAAARHPRLRRAAALGLAGGTGLLLGLGWTLRPAPPPAPAPVSTSAAASLAASGTARVTAPAAASAAAPVASAAVAPVAALEPLAPLLGGLSGPDAAWQALGALWAAPQDAATATSPVAGDASSRARPCGPDRPLRCHQAVMTLAQIRQLDRPGLLALQPEGADAGAAPRLALLVGLGERSATLRIDGRTRRVALGELAGRWNGQYATIWRAPPGLPADLSRPDEGGAAAWLAQVLAKAMPEAGRAASAPLRERLMAFQRAQGLKADGAPGPMTLMQLNRATGVGEPRLTQEP